MKKLLALLTVTVGATVAFADGESLAETGGYVPVNAPGLAFKNITLADLGTTWFPSVTKGGGWAGGEAKVPLVLRTEETNDGVLSAVKYQAQWNDGGYLKCATIRFTNGEGGVYAQTVDAKYTGTGVAAAYLTDFAGGTQGYCAASASADGYGFCNLKLHQKGDLESISINFNDSEGSKLWTSDSVGLAGYAVGGMLWSQMLGTDGNTLPSVTAVGNDNGAFYAAASSQVRISGTRGSWSYGGYTAASDVRYGYIDDDINNTTPTVTISNIPFDRYKVIVYCSTDNENAQFGYVTINGVNYTSTNTEKAESGDFTTVEGTASWGKSRVTGAPIVGVNCLVSSATSARTLIVVGHRIGGGTPTARSCIAAIQIVKTTEDVANEYQLEVTGDVMWSDLTDFTGGADKRIYVNNDYGAATITFDTAVQAAELVLTGSGSTALKFTNAANNQIAGFEFTGLTGEVAIDDVIREAATFTSPSTGTLRYKGTATLTAAPYGSGAVMFPVVIDQPMNMSEFQLAGVKTLYGFGPSCNATFSSRFVLGNNNGANQTVTQYGGSIVVSGTSGPDTLNQASVLLGHWPSLIVNFNNYGGTFTASGAAARLGHDGMCYWTIGDGESDDSTARVTLKGIVNESANNNGGTGSKVVLRQGGTLNIGSDGISLRNSSVHFAGGKLSLAGVSISARTIEVVDGTDTEIEANTVSDPPEAQINPVSIVSPISGSGNITKTGSGTLRISATATATGELVVREGTLELSDDATWGGNISVSGGATLHINRTSVDPTSSLYLKVCEGTLSLDETSETPPVIMVNESPIDTDRWQLLEGTGTFVNKYLNGYTTTATADFAFSTAEWYNALGNLAETIFWEQEQITQITVDAENTEPAVATVDVCAANGDALPLNKFKVKGPGDLTFVAGKQGSGPRAKMGAVDADEYDFSESTGRIDYTLPTGDASVISGTNTVVSGGGSGTPTVAAGQTLTLGPWGTTEDDTTYTCGLFSPAVGSTLIFAPGEGKIQKSGGFGSTNAGTTIGVTNGTLVVDMAGGGESVFFGANSVRIDAGGTVSLEAQDALGYNNARSATINKGGVLSVKVRDTLKRTVTLNGGTIEVQGENGGRALDFFNNNIINVTDNSMIQAVGTEGVSNPTIWFRNGTSVINIDDGVTLSNNITYASTSSGESKGGVTVRGTMNHGNGNGMMAMNGFNGNPLTFVGLATIGENGKPAMYALNCEHQNGTYVVNAGSRLMGSGSITGSGGVTLSAANSKICGSLTVNNVTAAAGGTFGDQWNPVSAMVSGTLFTAGTQTIQNGSLTIGANCAVTNASGVANISDATFSVAADGNLVLGKSVSVSGLSVADGGTVTIAAARTGSAKLTVAGTATYNGAVNIVVDFGTASVPGGFKVPLLEASNLPALANVSVTDNVGAHKWRTEVIGNVLWAMSDGSLTILIR